jgi:hypothetical protein
MSVAFRMTDSHYYFTVDSVADINSDGKLDLLGNENEYPRQRLGNGDGTFQDISNVPDGILDSPPPSGIVSNPDFDGDGRTDLLTAGAGFITLSLAQADGGTQTQQVALGHGVTLSNMLVSDVNGDGRPDIIANAIGVGGYVKFMFVHGYPYSAVFLNTGLTSTISSSVVAHAITDKQTIRPFAGVTIAAQGDPAQTLSLAVTLGGNGGFSTVSGSFSKFDGASFDTTRNAWTLTGNAAVLTAALDGALFTPRENILDPGWTSTGGLTIAVTDADGRTVSDIGTSLLVTSVNDAPRITGGLAGQTMTEEQTLRPFTDVAISDPDWSYYASQNITVTVALDDPAKGSLSSGSAPGSWPWPGSYDAASGVYTVTGYGGDVGSAVRNLVFRPSSYQERFGAEVTTVFTISAKDSVDPTAITTATASVTTIINVLDDAPTDFFGQGTSDILMQNARTGACYIWKTDGVVVSGGGYAGWAPGAAWQAQGTGDFNGDGKADILLQNANTGTLFVFAMNGIGLAGGGQVGPEGIGPAWVARGISDFNGDARSDVVLQNAVTGQVQIWQVNGTAVTGASNIGTAVGSEWQVKATGDFNGDRHADLLFQHSGTGASYIWEMNGSEVVAHGAAGWAPGAAWEAKGSGDFNGDGRSDILLQHAGTGECCIWMMDGTNLLGGGSVAWAPGAAWQADAVGDFNNDGRSDILLQNSETGACYIWLMDGITLIGSGFPGWTPGAEWQVIG